MSVATAAELRSAWLLRLLALALAPPSPLDEAMLDLGRALSAEEDEVDVGRLVAAFERTSPEERATTYQLLFGGKVAIAPYESSYERDPFRQARVMADVAGFYRAFGAEAHGPTAERPDHAGTELEFLGLLAERRVAALDAGAVDEAERIYEIEDAFLTDHAGRWLPGFFRALAIADADGPFGALGLVGEQVLAAELVARGLTDIPIVRLDRGQRTSVEQDELPCASGDADVSDPAPTRGRGSR